MSSKGAHTAAGIALALLGGVAMSGAVDLATSMAFAAGAGLASSLPDQLEIKWFTGGGKRFSLWGAKYKEGTRHSLIPHRTITHWLLLWIALAGASIYSFQRSYAVDTAFWCGVALSALLHVVMDSRTPMGIPWFHPYKRTEGKHG